ncbi:hypothetical protein E2562_038442, partial [Oryza meyeriana var. granulata]
MAMEFGPTPVGGAGSGSGQMRRIRLPGWCSGMRPRGIPSSSDENGCPRSLAT